MAESEFVYGNDKYSEIRKNTVEAKNQLSENEYVSFSLSDQSGLKVLFLGNSMTRHGVKIDIGWYHDHGMAASEKEKDYVHILMKKIRQMHPHASFCVCQGSEWERNYTDGQKIFCQFDSARAFGADIIVMRLIENCPVRGFDGDTFKKELWALLDYLNPSGKAKVILTTGFWRHPGDAFIRELARERKLSLAELGELGDRDDMKALGLFLHKGVANHPGDRGMEAIAERIFECF